MNYLGNSVPEKLNYFRQLESYNTRGEKQAYVDEEIRERLSTTISSNVY